MDNYYSPLYYRSTADSEFMTQTSLFPNKNVTLSMDAYMENTFPYTIASIFNNEGYETFSYHNYIDYFFILDANFIRKHLVMGHIKTPVTLDF